MAALKNARHETFCRAILEGKTQRAAYIDAYPAAKKWQFGTLDNRAWELAKRPEVAARIDELKTEAATAAVLSCRERLVMLSEIAKDTELDLAQRLKAIDLLNKMESVYVQKVDANVHGDLSAAAAQVQAIMNE